MFNQINENLQNKSFTNFEVILITIIAIATIIGLSIGIAKATAKGCNTMKKLKKQEQQLNLIIDEQKQIQNTEEALKNVCKICKTI